MLNRVINPSRGHIDFGYDPLGRRVWKEAKGKKTCWLWDGNTPLHEWQTTEKEPLIDIVTWVFEDGTFVSTARITDKGSQSIVTDYLGTPIEAYNESGEKVWEREIDIYGRVRKENLTNFVPFLYQGQYVDTETGLAYNRFRYYDASIGSYISQDPIGLAGGNSTIYGYVDDVNGFVDVFGLTRGARVSNLPPQLQRRPKWRQSTRDELDSRPKAPDGRNVDVKTRQPIEPGNEVIGHQNQSWREYQENPANLQKTRAQVIEDYNDVGNLGYEDKTKSSSDGGRLKGHEH